MRRTTCRCRGRWRGAHGRRQRVTRHVVADHGLHEPPHERDAVPCAVEAPRDAVGASGQLPRAHAHHVAPCHLAEVVGGEERHQGLAGGCDGFKVLLAQLNLLLHEVLVEHKYAALIIGTQGYRGLVIVEQLGRHYDGNVLASQLAERAGYGALARAVPSVQEGGFDELARRIALRSKNRELGGGSRSSPR